MKVSKTRFAKLLGVKPYKITRFIKKGVILYENGIETETELQKAIEYMLNPPRKTKVEFYLSVETISKIEQKAKEEQVSKNVVLERMIKK